MNNAEVNFRFEALKSAIKSNASTVWSVVDELLGPKTGGSSRMRCYGSVDGGKGKSFTIWDSGVWVENNPAGSGIPDHRGNIRHRGSLINLYVFKTGMGFKDAVNAMCLRFGVPQVFVHTEQEEQRIVIKATKELEEAGASPSVSGGVGCDYFKGRGIRPETVRLFRVHDMASHSFGDITTPAVAMPYLSRDGSKVLKVKYRSTLEKRFDCTRDCSPVPFGLHLCDPKCKTMVICESEIDAMSVKQACHDSAVIAMGGSGGVHGAMVIVGDWITKTYKDIVIMMDSDPAGITARNQLVDCLGMNHCRIAFLPPGIKDANELLQKLGDDSVRRSVDQASKPKPISYFSVKSATGTLGDKYYSDLFKNAYVPEELGKCIKLLPWECSLWVGPTGCGKSTLLRQVLSKGALNHRIPFLYITLEDSRDDVLYDLTYTLKGEAPAQPDAELVANWADSTGLMHIVDYHNIKGEVKFDDQHILRDIRQFHEAFGVQHIAIDNITFLHASAAQFEKAREFAINLFKLAAQLKVHLHIVCHVSKQSMAQGRKKTKEILPHEVRGVSEIALGSQNIISIYRDREEEKEMSEQQLFGRRYTYSYVSIVKARRSIVDAANGTHFKLKMFANSRQLCQEQATAPHSLMPKLLYQMQCHPIEK